MRLAMKTRRGVVFILTLLALVAVITSVSLYAANQNDVVRAAIQRNEKRRAKIAAEAGLQRALTELQAVLDAPQSPVTLEDEWAILGNSGADNFIIGNESFRMQIVDNASLVDLNTAPQEVLVNLNFTQEQIDSLLDWRESGTTPRAEGAKDDYYNGLSKPYNARLGRLQSVLEVLDIKGFTPDSVFNVQNSSSSSTTNVSLEVPIYDLVTIDSYSNNNNPEGDGRVNINQIQVNAQQLAQRAQIPIPQATQIISARDARPGQTFTSLSQVTTIGGIANNQAVLRSILDRVTITGTERIEGRVNVNTASVEVLASIPNIPQDIAQAIVDQRPSGGYATLSALLSVNSQSTFVGAAADSLTTNSQSFNVRILGKVGTATYALVALITIENGALRIVRIEKPPFPDMPTRWNWSEQSGEVTLLEKS
jgi:type II secretory pathway component PulK